MAIIISIPSPTTRSSSIDTFSLDARVVILEYDVHGKIIRTGASYDNRFISVVTIGNRKIVHWRDYMDSLSAMTALSKT